MNEEAMVKAFSQVKQGDIMEMGLLFEGMEPEEKVVWQVLEVAPTETGSRITLHLYYLDTFLMPLIAHLEEDRIEWGGEDVR